MWRVLQRKVRTLATALDGEQRTLTAGRAAWEGEGGGADGAEGEEDPAEAAMCLDRARKAQRAAAKKAADRAAFGQLFRPRAASTPGGGSSAGRGGGGSPCRASWRRAPLHTSSREQAALSRRRRARGRPSSRSISTVGSRLATGSAAPPPPLRSPRRR